MKFHAIFHRFIRRLYYSRITVVGAENVPEPGRPLLVLCLHRNGAVDGFVYRAAVPGLVYLVRAKLRRGLIGKLFFNGVDVVRRGDGGRREDNLAMIETSLGQLQECRSFAVFPEGTSKLGPRHLPFKSGAARIALNYLERFGSLTVLPLGVHYECPWAFRSRLEVVVGCPIPLDLSSAATSRGARLREIKERFTSELETVGVNVPDEKYQDLAQKFAYIATLGTCHGYYEALKSMEEELPAGAVLAWGRLESKLEGRRVLRHQGVPLFPLRVPLAYAIATVLLAVPVVAGALLNIPPIALAYWAGRRFADDTNVIALWRILTGVPMLIVWAATWVVTTLALGMGWIALVYLGLTWLSVRFWYRLKKLAVASWNGLFHPGLRPEAVALHQNILAALSTRKP